MARNGASAGERFALMATIPKTMAGIAVQERTVPAGNRPADGARGVMPAIRAVLLDVDGTLYRQRPVQLRMAAEIGLLPVTARSLSRAREVARVIRTFRPLRAALRALGCPDEPLERLQYAETAKRTGVHAITVERIVAEWMFRRPLRHVARAKRSGLDAFLESALKRGWQIGALSDYPVWDKLAALGLRSY